jgi:hypothetical protein
MTEIKHPNILTCLHREDTKPKYIYLVLEYCGGTFLFSFSLLPHPSHGPFLARSVQGAI